MTDWNHIRRIRKHNLNGIMIFGQVRGGTVLILTQAYLNTVCSSFSLSSQITSLLFMVIPSLYSPSTLHPSLPPVDLAKNPLDACPIKTSSKLC